MIFELTCAVIYIKIGSVDKFSKSVAAKSTERNFKSEHLFRLCSVATDLVTSLDFKPIRCGTLLCLFGQTRNANLKTHFIVLCSTSESSATNGFVVVPERFGQNGEPGSRNEERTRKKPKFFLSGFKRRQMSPHVNKNFIHPFMYFTLCILTVFGAFSSDFVLWKLLLIFRLCQYLVCWCESNHFVFLFWRLGPVYSSVEGWRRRCQWKRKRTEICLFPAGVGIFLHRIYE